MLCVGFDFIYYFIYFFGVVEVGFLLCNIAGIGETDTALRAETAEETNRSLSRLPESRCSTQSPLVETTG